MPPAGIEPAHCGPKPHGLSVSLRGQSRNIIQKLTYIPLNDSILPSAGITRIQIYHNICDRIGPMITIRYLQPDKVINLYDYRKHKHFKGSLYVNSPATVLSQPLEKLSKFFLGLATIILLAVFFPVIYSEVRYLVSNIHFKKPQVIPALAEIPISDEFFLEIPKVNLTSTIVANVDSSNEEEYMEKLKVGVAHAKGSYFPGDNGPIVLFSHSTDTLAHIVQYNAKFYALKDLEIGDQITIHFKGKIFNYTVSEKKIIDPQNLDAIRQANAKLILTTCWPPGTDWQRIAVFAS